MSPQSTDVTPTCMTRHVQYCACSYFHLRNARASRGQHVSARATIVSPAWRCCPPRRISLAITINGRVFSNRTALWIHGAETNPRVSAKSLRMTNSYFFFFFVTFIVKELKNFEMLARSLKKWRENNAWLSFVADVLRQKSRECLKELSFTKDISRVLVVCRTCHFSLCTLAEPRGISHSARGLSRKPLMSLII